MHSNRKSRCSPHVLALALTAVVKTVCLGQFAPAAENATPSVTLTPNPGEFFRINNLFGNLSDIATAEPISSLPLSNTIDNNNYLSHLGQFTFANDYPILNARLTLTVNSVFTAGGTPSTITSAADGAPENRFSFLTQDFALLFVGQSGQRFMMAKDAAYDTAFYTDEDDFLLRINPGDLSPSLQYYVRDNTEYTLDGIPILKDNQLSSLEWAAGLVNDSTWDPRAEGPAADNLDDTFPVAGDVPDANLPFYLERGTAVGGISPLYSGGAGERRWDVYLFTTGRVLSGAQLNLSEITVALVVPEAHQAVAGGAALIFVAGLLRSRRRA